MDQESEKFECWGIVEVMGHSRYAGKVSEQAIGGCAFVRVDVPEHDGRPAFTKFLGQGSIFAITPTTEEIARHAAMRSTEPVSVFDLPRLTPQLSNALAPPDDGDSYSLDY